MQAFEFERRIEDPNLQVGALLKVSSAKTKPRNRAAVGHLIDTSRFMEQLGIPFRGHGDTGHLEPVSDIKDVDTSAESFLVILQLYSIGNPKFSANHKESLSDATYLGPNI